jgi:hypothetical protein
MKAARGYRDWSFGRWLVALGCLAFCLTVLFLLFRSQPVEVTESHLAESGGQIYIAGKVRNRGDSPSSVKLELHYYDQSGHALGNDILNLNDLGAGAERTFRGPMHDQGTIADYSIYLNRGRNPYGN